MGHMQPQVTWALGCMGEKGAMKKDGLRLWLVDLGGISMEKSWTCEGMSAGELCGTELRARVRIGK